MIRAQRRRRRSVLLRWARALVHVGVGTAGSMQALARLGLMIDLVSAFGYQARGRSPTSSSSTRTSAASWQRLPPATAIASSSRQPGQDALRGLTGHKDPLQPMTENSAKPEHRGLARGAIGVVLDRLHEVL